MERNERKQTRIEAKQMNTEPSRTKQEGREAANVNNIVNTFARTGMWANVNPRQATYGDVSEMLSLEVAFQKTREAQDEFMKLPSHVRDLAGNSPVRLLELLASEKGVQMLEAAGMEVRKAPREAGGQTPTEGGNAA